MDIEKWYTLNCTLTQCLALYLVIERGLLSTELIPQCLSRCIQRRQILIPHHGAAPFDQMVNPLHLGQPAGNISNLLTLSRNDGEFRSLPSRSIVDAVQFQLDGPYTELLLDGVRFVGDDQSVTEQQQQSLPFPVLFNDNKLPFKPPPAVLLNERPFQSDQQFLNLEALRDVVDPALFLVDGHGDTRHRAQCPFNVLEVRVCGGSVLSELFKQQNVARHSLNGQNQQIAQRLLF